MVPPGETRRCRVLGRKSIRSRGTDGLEAGLMAPQGAVNYPPLGPIDVWVVSARGILKP